MIARPEISIIMPLYNTEQWLGTAIESVMLQEGPSWELLAVDDGSTDESLNLLKQYVERDNRIKLLRNAGIKGAGGSRNTALREAHGKNIFFFDSDDALFPGALRLLHGLMADSDSPVVRGVSTFFCQQRWLAGEPDDTSGRVEISRNSHPSFGFWLHLYNAEFLSANGLSFPEDLIIGQDRAFLWQVYFLLSSVPVVHSPIYLYRINHKLPNPSSFKSRAFLNGLLRIRQSCLDTGNDALIAHLLQGAFIPEWLGRLYPMYQEGRDSALEFLEGCTRILSGHEDAVAGELRQQMGEQSEEFLGHCKSGNTEGMLAALEEAGCIAPPAGYMGIRRPTSGLGWQCYRLARRMRSLTSLSDESRRTMLYLYMLRRNSLRRLRGLPPASLGDFWKAGAQHASQ